MSVQVIESAAMNHDGPQLASDLPECLKRFVLDCRAVRHRSDWPEQVAGLLSRLIGGPAPVNRLVRQTVERQGRNVFYYTSEDLTIYPMLGVGGLRGPPHDHATRAVVGMIEGVEQYKLFRETASRVAEVGWQRLMAPDTTILDGDVIHALWNEPDQESLSIHVYGNGHFHEPRRRMWHPVTREQRLFDLDTQTRWNRELTASSGA
jgi:predicted metal-dependent enzyme (double-stranded beta helix superfamily)